MNRSPTGLLPAHGGEEISGLERRLAAVEAGLAVTQEAVARLRERIKQLEAAA